MDKVIVVRLPVGRDGQLSPRLVTALLRGLTAVNVELLRDDPSLFLRAARAHYRREPFGTEDWQTAYSMAVTGDGDCEDFGSLWAAAMQLAGDPYAEAVATPMGQESRPPYRRILHITSRGNGLEIDPSMIAVLRERMGL